jgi:hypothetical protein
MAGVLREINSIYNAGRRGLIPASDCSKLASVVDIARRTLESGDLEKRLKSLEAQLGAARQGSEPSGRAGQPEHFVWVPLTTSAIAAMTARVDAIRLAVLQAGDVTNPDPDQEDV